MKENQGQMSKRPSSLCRHWENDQKSVPFGVFGALIGFVLKDFEFFLF
jgi:hypothetical protein